MLSKHCRPRLTTSLQGSKQFFWGSKATQSHILIDKDEEMKIMQYQGRIEDFSQNAKRFEMYLQGKEASEMTIESKSLIEGRCTPEGTLRYKERAVGRKGIPAKNFRKPFPLPFGDGRQDAFNLSTVGLGTYMGKPDDQDDFDLYIAAKYLLRSGALNVLDTASNYRCQKSERTLGAVLSTLLDEELAQDLPDDERLSRDEIFVSSKSGYIPDDADHGIPAATLVEQLIDEGKITKEDVAGEIHCMHPNFLEHQLQAS